MSPAKRLPSPRPPLVLVVENDLHTREMYAEWLKYSGFRVAQAAQAAQAIQKARALRPDVITTDIGLSGGQDGVELCAHLKSDAVTKAIPVIAVTAWAMGGYVERAKLSGCDSVLVKPCLPQTLLSEIQRLLKLPLDAADDTAAHSRARALRLAWPQCPACAQRTGLPLDLTSAKADTLYVECRECGHVWTLPKRTTRPTK